MNCEHDFVCHYHTKPVIYILDIPVCCMVSMVIQNDADGGTYYITTRICRRQTIKQMSILLLNIEPPGLLIRISARIPIYQDGDGTNFKIAESLQLQLQCYLN